MLGDPVFPIIKDGSFPAVGVIKEIERILSFLGESYSSDILEMSKKPSAVSRKDSAIIAGTDLLNAWKKNINDKQVERAVEICSIFGLQAIYNKSNFPLISGKEALSVLSAQQDAAPDAT